MAISTRGAFKQELPELPRRGERQPGIEVDHLAKQALGDGVLQRQHHRREAQLEIDGGLQLLGATDLEDARRFGEIAAHRLLDQRDRAVRQRLQHARHDATGGVARSKIASLTAAASSTEPKAFTPHASASFAALALIGIVQAGDRKAGLAVGREMRVADDRPCAEGDDGPGLRRHRPGLHERGRVKGHAAVLVLPACGEKRRSSQS